MEVDGFGKGIHGSCHLGYLFGGFGYLVVIRFSVLNILLNTIL